MQVDTRLYEWDLRKEWKRGAKRAAASAFHAAQSPAQRTAVASKAVAQP
jgi:hypothetical protein